MWIPIEYKKLSLPRFISNMFESKDFRSVFDRFTNYKVLIIGDVMIDTYLWGNIGRVSPEAPVPIVSGVIEENRLGGAANVALNIKALGAVPILCSVIGDDDRGKLILELMEEQLLSDIGLVVDIFLNKRIQEEFLELVSSLLESGGIDAIIMQDYDKGVLTPRVISEVISASERVNIPVLVDPKFRSFDLYKKVKLFKPNFKELVKGLDLDISKKEIEKLADAVLGFQKKQQIENIIVTLSEQGILSSVDGEHVHIPAIKREITDVSGAGDTVIAVAALCIVAGFSPAEVAAVSNLAGGQVCEKAGVVPVNLERLMDECMDHFKSS
jgi:bifunctional ADP-heptose synthase (sugar kinase/adenylyltransferase)